VGTGVRANPLSDSGSSWNSLLNHPMTDHDNQDRLPPHAPDAERGVLGCVLADHSCLNEARQKLDLDAFYDQRHREIFRCLCELDDDQAGVDYINLVQKLRTSERLDAIGGIVYLSEMTDAIASVLNLSSCGRW
jgi:replicative DNA helicase